MVELRAKKVLVVGAGRSGVAAARLCALRGAAVTVTDSRAGEALAAALEQLGGCATLELGGHRPQSFLQADLIVLSPGVPEIPPLAAARRQGVPILGELELSYRFVEAPILAVTGTNGKSTTTSLLGAMVAAGGRPTFVGGNLGIPLAEAVGTAAAGPGGALVLELSSFQLETVQTFRAQVALLLNLTEDHLDRYPDFASYRAAKARIFERQTPADFAVVSGEPEQQDCQVLGGSSAGSHYSFRLQRGAELTGAWLDGGDLVVRLAGGPEERLPRDKLPLAGLHNVQNALAALLAARLFGSSLDDCCRALASFQGLPHRMELVAERGGVRFYNDSKATNVGSVVGSLTGFERRIVLIAGGKDKGGDYAPLVPLLQQVARAVVLIGAAAEKMAGALAGSVPLHRASSLPEAVRLAASLAQPGEAVVLSPACSSYDMFANYEQRGQVFAQAASALPGAPGGR